MAVIQRCKRHPRYKALKPPTSSCARCWRIWDFTALERVIVELKSSMGKIEAQMDSLEARALGTINREASRSFRSAFDAALKVVREEAKAYINGNFMAGSEHTKVGFGIGGLEG